MHYIKQKHVYKLIIKNHIFYVIMISIIFWLKPNEFDFIINIQFSLFRKRVNLAI